MSHRGVTGQLLRRVARRGFEPVAFKLIMDAVHSSLCQKDDRFTIIHHESNLVYHVVHHSVVGAVLCLHKDL